MITYEQIVQDPAVREYISRADESLMALGYTEHSFAHVTRVAETAKYIMEKTTSEEESARLYKRAQDL